MENTLVPSTPSFNPFVHDLGQLKEAELDQKIIELSKKFWQTQNPDLRMQIQTILEMYKTELHVRQAQKKVQSQDNGDNPLDNLINIS